MKIEEFFNSIQQNKITDDLIIFKNSENNFLSLQYIKEISKQHSIEISYVEDVSMLKTTYSIFDSFIGDVLQVVKIDKFECKDSHLVGLKNIIIICDSIDKETDKIYKNYVISIPKLEDWQIKDYIYTQLDGITETDVETIFKLCAGNIYRIDNEVNRLTLFTEKERSLYLQRFIKDGVYDDIAHNTSFDFVNAIITRNTSAIRAIYPKLHLMDISVMGIVQLLYNGFRNVIMVQCSKVSSAETCGLKPNQFWAVKHNIGFYSRDELSRIFLSITDIDRKLKTGELGVDMILDYILVDILK